MSTKTIEVHIRSQSHCKQLQDPIQEGLSHVEAWLPFSEAAKLDRGNANVRPPSGSKKPFKAMMDTVENDPGSFHVKNRGISYVCKSVDADARGKIIRLELPKNSNSRYGIADGGHTYEVISQTVERMDELKSANDDWSEPFVRVRFMAAGPGWDVQPMVEALNTSSQVQPYTLDEYQGKFDEIKQALDECGFDTNLVAFRENEEEKPWDIREIIQRMACFLQDRWGSIQPVAMYRSKGRALDLYISEATRPEFRALYPVIKDIITLPEYIEAEFSTGEVIQAAHKFGKLRAVRGLKKPYSRPGTDYITNHRMDLAASLPIAAAFRELLRFRGGKYVWQYDPHEAFANTGDALYQATIHKSRTAKTVNSMGQDPDYWLQCSNVLLRSKDQLAGK